MTIVLFMLVCGAAALYGAALGMAAAGERVPVLTAFWEWISRPAEALVEVLAARFRRS